MVNNVAVLIAAIATFFVGFLWYGPLFGKKWMKLSGMTMAKINSKKKQMPFHYLFGFLSTLITALVLAFFINWTASSTWQGGALVGFWVWLGFVATNTLGGVLWELKPLKLWVLNNCYNLLTLAMMGAIIGGW